MEKLLDVHWVLVFLGRSLVLKHTPPEGRMVLKSALCSGDACSVSCTMIASLVTGRLKVEVAVLMVATLTLPSLPGDVLITWASGHWFVKS